MEFIVNEAGCRQLGDDMENNMNQILALVNEINAHNGMLRGALGDDYDAIAKSVNYMAAELQNAYSELNVIITDMNEYMSRVHMARVSLG